MMMYQVLLLFCTSVIRELLGFSSLHIPGSWQDQFIFDILQLNKATKEEEQFW